MHGTAPLLGVRHGVDGVDRRLGALELLAVLDDRAGLVQAGTQLLRSRVRLRRRPWPSPDGAPHRRNAERNSTRQDREAPAHETDATVAPASCLARRAPPEAPSRRQGRLRPKEGEIGPVTPYEILLMLDPELPEERQSEIVQRTRELVERSGGSVDAHDVWGRRKLAYEIDHKTDGTYHLLTFTAETETLEEISRILKITDGVMRHLAVRRSERRPGETVAASAPTRQDGAKAETVVQEEE